LLRTRNRKS